MEGRWTLTCAHVRHKEESTPSDADQRVVSQYSLVAHVTRSLRAHNADLSEQAPVGFPVRYSLREGGTWEANASQLCSKLGDSETPIERCLAACALLPSH